VHFKFLSEVGDHYDTETAAHIMQGAEPLRKAILLQIAAQVLNARTRYEQDLRARGIHGKVASNIQARMALLQQASGAPAPAVTEPQLALSKARYEKALKHFQNQGGVLTRDGHLDWGASDQLVVYDRTLAAQNLTKLRIHNNKLYADDARTKPFDTAQMSTVHSGLGFAIYVMSEEGNIHASSHAIGFKHHSSLLAAANTAGAGEIQVKDGLLEWISNKSGHYVPSVAHFIQTLHLLQKKGINLGPVKVQYHTANTKTPYANVGDFMATLQPEEDYYHAKMIGYINSYPVGHLDAIVAANNWHFPSNVEYHVQNKKGIIDNATGAAVSHKLVCQYFKGQGLACDPVVNATLLQKGAGR
jgi:hypothetical protein